jgi:hypothetical protein
MPLPRLPALKRDCVAHWAVAFAVTLQTQPLHWPLLLRTLKDRKVHIIWNLAGGSV